MNVGVYVSSQKIKWFGFVKFYFGDNKIATIHLEYLPLAYMCLRQEADNLILWFKQYLGYTFSCFTVGILTSENWHAKTTIGRGLPLPETWCQSFWHVIGAMTSKAPVSKVPREFLGLSSLGQGKTLNDLRPWYYIDSCKVMMLRYIHAHLLLLLMMEFDS